MLRSNSSNLFCADKPGMTDMKGKAKWEAWNSRKGKKKNNIFIIFKQLKGMP